MENPLHHFELHPLVHMSLFGLDVSINKAVVTMWVVIALVFMMFRMAASRGALVPAGVQNLVELGVEFIRNMAEDNIGSAGRKYVPFLISLFFFVLFCNLIGLVPGSFTVTSQLFVTGALAVAVYVMSLVVGFKKHGTHFLSILVPGGTPGWLVPLMIFLTAD